jgi:hypothetical protein
MGWLGGTAGGGGAALGIGGGTVVPVLRGEGGGCTPDVLFGFGAPDAVERGGSCTPVGGALRAPRRGGNGGKRRPHA